MKKTLVALSVTAFAATSASAATIYEKDGSKVDLYGSARFVLEKNTTKVGDAKRTGHTNLRNDGSRIGFKVNHMVSDDFYALGEVQVRFNGKKLELKDGNVNSVDTVDEFGNLYVNEAFVGLGSKQLGELTFGRRGTLGGDVAQAGFSKKYDKFEGLLTGDGKAVVRYDYKGVEGLTVSADYRFAEERADGEVVNGKLKSGYGVAALYEAAGATVAAGYTRDNFVVAGSAAKHFKNAYGLGAKYAVSGVTFGADYVASYEYNAGVKTFNNGFRLGAKFEVAPSVAVFTNYGRGVKVEKAASKKTTKGDFLLFGASYDIAKNVTTYAQLGYHTSKAKGQDRTRNLNAGVGLHVSF